MKQFFIVSLFVLLCVNVLARDKTRTIIDGNGNTVTVPEKVTRIAANGAINQVVLLLGGGDKMVATSIIVQQNPMFVKIYPRIKELPAPFAADLKSLNMEELLAAKPQVVFGSFEQLKGDSVVSVALSLTNPDEIKKTVLLVGKILGEKEGKRAEEFVRYYDENITKVTAKTAGIPRTMRPKIYLASGTDGLKTEGKNTIVSAWIDVAGGINIANEYNAPEMVLENIVVKNPDLIIATTPAVRDKIISDPKWASINAVKMKQVYVNPKGVYLWSVRSAEGALQFLWAAKMIHPELFADLNIENEVRDFYRKYYGYQLLDDELEKILEPR